VFDCWHRSFIVREKETCAYTHTHTHTHKQREMWMHVLQDNLKPLTTHKVLRPQTTNTPQNLKRSKALKPQTHHSLPQTLKSKPETRNPTPEI
jgi:hypothetical protein